MLFAYLSIPILLIGIVIYKFKFVEILAGYDSKKIADKDGLSRWVGINLIFMAVMIIFINIALYIADVSFVHEPLFYIAIILIITTRIIIGTKKYEIQKED